MKVHRYQLKFTDGPQQLLMPDAADVLTARVEGAQLYLYAAHASVQPNVARVFHVVATDEDFAGAAGVWVGTVTKNGTAYHVFQK